MNIFYTKLFTSSKKMLFDVHKIKKFQYKQYFNFCTEKEGVHYLKDRLLFNNGKSLIFTYLNLNKIRNYNLLIISFLAFISYKSIKQLYNYNERNFFGFIFYGFITISSIRYMKNLTNIYNSIIKDIYLSKDGKHIYFTYKYYIRCQNKKIDISQIQQPSQAQKDARFGQLFQKIFMPVYIENKIYYVRWDFENWIQGKILEAIVKGRYIDTAKFEDEIIL